MCGLIELVSVSFGSGETVEYELNPAIKRVPCDLCGESIQMRTATDTANIKCHRGRNPCLARQKNPQVWAQVRFIGLSGEK